MEKTIQEKGFLCMTIFLFLLLSMFLLMTDWPEPKVLTGYDLYINNTELYEPEPAPWTLPGIEGACGFLILSIIGLIYSAKRRKDNEQGRNNRTVPPMD